MAKLTTVEMAAGAAAGAAFVLADRAGLIPAIAGYDPTWPADRLRIAPGVVLYLLFGVYWSLAARNRAADRISEAGWSVALHRILVSVSMLLIILPIPGLMTRILPSSPIVLGAGLAVEVAGAVLAVAARRRLGPNWSAEVRIAQDHELVRSGPYRRLRHPIYTGVLLIYLGLAMAAGRVGALLGLGLVVVAYLRKVRLEERVLERAFGQAFADYRAASWALIPPLY